MLAAFVNVSANVGYPLLALLVGAESAGALVPGETALIVAAALAGQGRLSLRLVARGDEFFQRHGDAAVFFRRWLPGLPVAAAWLAGESRMPWWRFLLWNALGGIGWASTIGTASYFLGKSASGSLGAIGFVGVGIAAVVFLIARRRELIRRRAGYNPNAASDRRSRSIDG